MWDQFQVQLFAYTVYKFCVQIVYTVLMMNTFCKSELMYAKSLKFKGILESQKLSF